MTTMTNFLGDMFVIAFRIVLPIFVCIMILNCILGIMAKVAPQMNIFAVGMQMKIVLGFAVLFITSILMGDVGNFIFREIQRMMVSVIKGLY